MNKPTGSALGSTLFASRNSYRFWLVLVLIALVVFVLGWFSHKIVKAEIRHLVETNLMGSRQLISTIAHDWAIRNVGIAERVVKRNQLRQDLAGVRSGDATAYAQVVTALDAIATSAEITWWSVVDYRGKIIVASNPAHVGQFLPAEAPLTQALEGKGCLSKAVSLKNFEISRPFFLACCRIPMSPSKIENELILVQAHDPAGSFNSIITQSISGESMESYAFDEQGRMLTTSRFLDQLKSANRVPADATTSIFNLELRDPAAPGADPKNAKSWPLTRMAAAAIAGKNGIDLDGYNDYRGESVVGAWTWCPEHHIGIAVEVDRAEAYRALDNLRVLFLGLIALLFAVGVILALYLRRTATLARRARQAERTVQELGQYQLERKLGEGGMGAVYAATHRLLRRRTAVKLISGTIDADVVARFEREVRLCCQLSHPNTIAIYDFGRTAEGVFYYAMEHLEGADLENIVQDNGPMPPGRVINILVQACGSLGEAHRAKLLHRDIKPANIFITDRGGIFDFVKVLDFGLVKDLAKTSGASLSQADIISGTPQYMSPEVISQKPNLDGRVDLYALALIGVYLLTGKTPFDRENAMACVMAHLNEPITSLAPYGTIPADLERVLLSCLAKDPAVRPVDAEVFAASLLECADAHSWTQKDARRWWEKHAPSKKEDKKNHTERKIMPSLIIK